MGWSEGAVDQEQTVLILSVFHFFSSSTQLCEWLLKSPAMIKLESCVLVASRDRGLSLGQ